jgi:hypothetical protein
MYSVNNQIPMNLGTKIIKHSGFNKPRNLLMQILSKKHDLAKYNFSLKASMNGVLNFKLDHLKIISLKTTSYRLLK